VEELAEILHQNLPEDEAESRAHKLAADCAMEKTEAVDKVNEILSRIDVEMENVLRVARRHKAEELTLGYVRRKSSAVKSVDKLLAHAGMTIDALIAKQLEEQLESLERVDRLTTIAEGRRNASLREIDRRRSALGEKLRHTMRGIEEHELTLIESTIGKGKDAA